jgi:serine/threonine protein kinase
VMPLLDGLEAVHGLDYLHRDIKPSNIYLSLDNHRPLLLDFGAAHQIVVSRSRPITQILTPPYAPIEQWGHELPLGPYTDIHAMGVVLYEAMLADKPFPNAPDRLGKDPFTPLVRQLRGQEYSERFLKAVDWALQLQAKDRPQNVEEWRKALAPKTQIKPVKPLPWRIPNWALPNFSLSPEALRVCVFCLSVLIGVAVLATLISVILINFAQFFKS